MTHAVSRTAVIAVMIALAATSAAPAPAAAQWTWTDQAELSFVYTGGNSSSSTFGAKNALHGEGAAAKFAFEAGGIRTRSSVRTRVANGTPGNFTVTETSVSDVTAENYFAKGRFDVTVSGTAYWFAGSGWTRNTFAGIDSRIGFVSGAGNQWVHNERTTFRTDLGGTYTIQNNVAAGPVDRFAGVQFTGELSHAVTDNTAYESKLVVDENLENTDDLRGDFVNSLTVAMNSRLALKTSLQLLFDNAPSFADVPLFTGGQPAGTVPAELRKLDSIFTVALVINIR